MYKTFLVLFLAFTVLYSTTASRCDKSRLRKQKSRYRKCVNKGFNSKIGCRNKRDKNDKNVSRVKNISSCRTSERYLKKYGYQCKNKGGKVKITLTVNPTVQLSNDVKDDLRKEDPVPDMLNVGPPFGPPITWDSVEKYPLINPLRVGDEIKVWGSFEDETTDKFSINIMGPEDPLQDDYVLVHVEFRPVGFYPIVINNKSPRYPNWGPEVNPVLLRHFFEKQTTFDFKIEVLENEYKLSLNGRELSERFPQRDDIADAKYLMLSGSAATNGIQWGTIQLTAAMR